MSIQYYNNNAKEFFTQTVSVDLFDIYPHFLTLLPKGAHILDAGAGSGRDTLFFTQGGFKVTAIDGSEELAKLASTFINQRVDVLRFQEMDFQEEFDGIWACASLIHVPHDEMHEVFVRLQKALKHEGFLYASFKYGNYCGLRNERYFCDYNEDTFKIFLEDFPNLKLVKLWVTEDARPSRKEENWLNVILQKQ